MYARESAMYPDVAEWLRKFLKQRFQNSISVVADTSTTSLKEFITRIGYQKYFKPEWITYELQVDITGIMMIGDVAELAFVECKNTPLTLAHLSQLLGYSRIALPRFSFLISPRGYSDSLLSLLKTYNRTDILIYKQDKGLLPASIIVATWNTTAKTIETGTIIPPDAVQRLGAF